MTGKTKRVSLFLRTGRSVRIKVPTVRWMLFLSVPSNHWANSSNQREKRKIKAPLPKGTNGWVKYNPQVRFNLLGVSDETLWSLKWLENHQKKISNSHQDTFLWLPWLSSCTVSPRHQENKCHLTKTYCNIIESIEHIKLTELRYDQVTVSSNENCLCPFCPVCASSLFFVLFFLREEEELSCLMKKQSLVILQACALRHRVVCFQVRCAF